MARCDPLVKRGYKSTPTCGRRVFSAKLVSSRAVTICRTRVYRSEAETDFWKNCPDYFDDELRDFFEFRHFFESIRKFVEKNVIYIFYLKNICKRNERRLECTGWKKNFHYCCKTVVNL